MAQPQHVIHERAFALVKTGDVGDAAAKHQGIAELSGRIHCPEHHPDPV